MSEQKPLNIRRTGIVVIAIGLFAFIVYLYFIGLGEVIGKIREADPFYYSSAVAAMFFSVAFYALTWQRLLQLLDVKSPFRKALQFVWAGSFVDILIPAESVSGDVTRIYLMRGESGGSTGKIVASVIGQRILAMTVTLSGLVVSSLYFIVNYNPPLLVSGFIGLIGISTLSSILLIFYLSKKRGAADRAVNWLIGLLVRLSRGRWKFESLQEQAERALKEFHDGIDAFSVRPRLMVLPVSLSLLAWMFDLLIAVLVFRALGAAAPLSAIVIVYSISTAVQTVPVGIPGEVGVLDAVMLTLYTLLGVPIAMSAAATVLIRIVTLWVRLLVGGFTVQWLGIKGLRTTTRQSEEPAPLS